MTHHDPEEDPVAASLAFDRRLRESSAYQEMNTSLRRRTYVGVILASLLLINIVLGVIAINASYTAQNAIDQQRTTCIASNEFRKEDHNRWLFVESLVAPQPRSVETQKNVTIFENYINKTDSLRDCSKVS